MNMNIEWKFVTISELLDYAVSHPEKEIGFTSDSKEAISDDGEPRGWYGIKCTKAFDGYSFILGYYGGGVVWCEDNIGDNVFYEFWKSEFNEVLTKDRLICVDAGDMK